MDVILQARQSILVKIAAEGLTSARRLVAHDVAFELRQPNPQSGRYVWVVAEPAADTSDRSPWDWAHALLLADPARVVFAEPDFCQSWECDNKLPAAREWGKGNPPDPYWPAGPFAWHLTASELDQARTVPGTDRPIRIAHLDTGFDDDHVTRPRHLRADLGWNFTKSGEPDDAREPRQTRGPNPGHGTGTLGILAGNRVKRPATGGEPPFDADLGGAPNAEVVPVRIADSVVHLFTSTMADGIRYALAPRKNPALRCDAVSISMGGLPSRAWAEAVDEAYDAGVLIVAAAGNPYGKSPPRHIVWPARFPRVIAACGVTAQRGPYYKPHNIFRRQGCFGPSSAMDTAMAAYTPNTPWAELGSGAIIDLDGAGTSAATPQIAVAAALWRAYRQSRYRRPWQRVEAVRTAMCKRASKPSGGRKYFGQGLLRAAAALHEPPAKHLKKTPDRLKFPPIGQLTRPRITQARRQMLELEALQIGLLCAEWEALFERASPKRVKTALAELAACPVASVTLRRFVSEATTAGRRAR